MKLNRHNYEEYFILYLDNELSSEDRREVEAFVSAHPDLKEELDLLMETRLTPDTAVTFGNIDSLLVRNSSAIDLNNYEEWLLCYIDNELTPSEIKDVENFVAAHPAAKKELELLQKVKLQPETISFPNKESLYRTEEKTERPVVVSLRWWRIAAAAVLLLGVSLTSVYVINKQPKSTDAGSVAIIDKGEKTIPSTPPADKNEGKLPATKSPDNNTELVTNTQSNDNREVIAPVSRQNAKEPVNRNNVAAAKKEREEKVTTDRAAKDESVGNGQLASNTADLHKPGSNNLPAPTRDNKYVFTDDSPTGALAVNPAPLTKDKLNPANSGVTKNTDKTYNTIEEAEIGTQTKDNSAFTFASNDEKKNKSRGLFRKIARTFEKRTNIKATDEDDRLLIAGLAIKLK